MVDIRHLLNTKNLSDFHIENLDEIPIVGYAVINESNWGRLDKIVLEYTSMDNYPLFLDFNGITDVNQLQIGQVLDIPDFSYLSEQIEELDILDSDSDENNLIPGVCKSANNKVTNDEQKSKTYSKGNKTTANTKLGITQQTVNYDQSSGIVKF